MAIESGTRATSAAAHGKHGHSLISDAKFRQLHHTALKLQLAARRQPRLRGREAALAGVAADLLAGDGLVAEFALSVDDIARGRTIPAIDRHSFDQRVIEALSQAVGDRLRNSGRITAIFFDAAHPGKILNEARTLAIAAKLPILFVEHRPAKPPRSASSKKIRKPQPLEYPSIPVDAQDVIATYRVAHESIARAREGSGPTHIVAVSWQIPAANGRKPARKSATQDAVTHLEEWLIPRGLPAQDWRREVVAGFAAAGQAQPFSANAANNAIENQHPKARAIA